MIKMQQAPSQYAWTWRFPLPEISPQLLRAIDRLEVEGVFDNGWIFEKVLYVHFPNGVDLHEEVRRTDIIQDTLRAVKSGGLL